MDPPLQRKNLPEPEISKSTNLKSGNPEGPTTKTLSQAQNSKSPDQNGKAKIDSLKKIQENNNKSQSKSIPVPKSKSKKIKKPPRQIRDASKSPNLNIDFTNLDLAVPDLEFLSEQNSQNVSKSELHRVSIAPMLDVTDRNFRVMIRFLTKKVTLYTDMVHADTILFSKFAASKLRIHPLERPVVMQLGGSNPVHLAKAAVLCERAGYDEINLNVGCPSPRVQKGAFGACLMKEPELVAKCVSAMEAVVSVPVTVKCRLGVDEFDSYEFMRNFVEVVGAGTNCKHFIIHARKAYLKGLNPKQNRNVPPLMYDRVYRIAKEFPQYKFSINGGIKSFEQTGDILSENPGLLGAMLGRLAYQKTWAFADLDRQLYGVPNPGLSRKEIFLKYGEYADMVLKQITYFKIPSLVRPLLGLFAMERGNRVMRRFMSDKKNYVKEKSFSSFMRSLVSELEKVNPEGLNERFSEMPLVESQCSAENYRKCKIEKADVVKKSDDLGLKAGDAELICEKRGSVEMENASNLKKVKEN